MLERMLQKNAWKILNWVVFLSGRKIELKFILIFFVRNTKHEMFSLKIVLNNTYIWEEPGSGWGWNNLSILIKQTFSHMRKDYFSG